MDLSTLLPPLESMTRRKPEVISPTCIRAHFTAHRYLDLSVEADGAVSAWAVGSLMVSNRVVKFAVLVGRLFEAPRLTQILRKATGLIQETISSGSRAATFLAKGVTADDNSILIYTASEVDPALAARWLTSFVIRNHVELEGDDKPAAKPAAKVKKLTVGVPAASA